MNKQPTTGGIFLISIFIAIGIISLILSTVPPAESMGQTPKSKVTDTPHLIKMADKDLQEGSKLIQEIREEASQVRPKILTKTVYRDRIREVKPKVALLVSEGKTIEVEPEEYKGYYVIDLEALNLLPDTVVVFKEFEDNRNIIQRILNKKPKK